MLFISKTDSKHSLQNSGITLNIEDGLFKKDMLKGRLQTWIIQNDALAPAEITTMKETEGSRASPYRQWNKLVSKWLSNEVFSSLPNLAFQDMYERITNKANHCSCENNRLIRFEFFSRIFVFFPGKIISFITLKCPLLNRLPFKAAVSWEIAKFVSKLFGIVEKSSRSGFHFSRLWLRRVFSTEQSSHHGRASSQTCLPLLLKWMSLRLLRIVFAAACLAKRWKKN